jgi:hypothetical protein
MAAKILKMLIGCRPGDTVGRGGGVDHEKIGRLYDLVIDFRLSLLVQVQNLIQDSTERGEEGMPRSRHGWLFLLSLGSRVPVVAPNASPNDFLRPVTGCESVDSNLWFQ